MSLAFLACVERGRLEAQTILLCRSIRRNAGCFADAPIHTFQPRKGTEIGSDTLAALRDLNVQHHTDELNRDLAHYPIGNKVFVCAHTEQTLAEDVLVFLDSDTMFISEPSSFALPSGVQIALRPVDHKNRGSTGPDDPNDEYWRRLYELCGVSGGRFIEAAVSDQRIRAYYNSGLICARRSSGIFQRWKHNLLRLISANHIPDGQITFMDQLALAATLEGIVDNAIHLLDARYNYPLPKRPLLPASRQYPLEQLVHLHYHRWFHRPGFLNELQPPFDPDTEMFRWIADQLPLHPIIDESLRF